VPATVSTPSSRPDDEPGGQARSLSAASANSHDDDDERDRRGGWLELNSIVGPGRGRIRATRIGDPSGNFAVPIDVQVRRAAPNTTYLIQRAPEVNPPPGTNPTTTTDGFCQRGFDLPPWSTVAARFLTFQSSTLTTDRRGNGALEFVFVAPVWFPAFDVMFRLLEVGDAPRSVLVSECTTMPHEPMAE
jgi:hypothetical protein